MGKKKKSFLENFSVDSFSDLDLETRYNIYILVAIAVEGILFLSLFNLAGSFGSLVASFLMQIFGRGVVFVLVLNGLLIANLLKIQKTKKISWEMDLPVGWGIGIIFLAILGLLSLLFGVRYPSNVDIGGGIVGYFFYPFLLSGSILDIGPIGSFFVLILVLSYGAMLASRKTIYDVFNSLKGIITHPNKIWDLIPDFFEIYRKFTKPPEETYNKLDTDLDEKVLSLPHPEKKLSPETVALNQKMYDLIEKEQYKDDNDIYGSDSKVTKTEHEVVYNPISDKDWVFPKYNYLIKSQKNKTNRVNVEENKLKIAETFAAFGIEVLIGDAITGPTVSQYTFRPASGIKLSRIAALQNDLALALAAPSIRMELPIPGKSAASIEIPNKNKTMVRIKDLLVGSEYQDFKKPLAIAVGKKVSGKDFVISLAKTPHMLVAGATGSGKSVWINSLLLSLLYRYSPKELQLILVDMKMVELNLYDGIPHLLSNVITTSDEAINALKWSVIEMDRRYKLLKQYGKRNIDDYNRFANKAKIETIPYTVFIIDELADLMVQAKSEVEPIIARLTAMSRAVGIHLVLGTQRPDVNVVTGLIKTNVPTRLCFAISSQIDSRVVLDASGGENLLGQGDGLIKSPAGIRPIRFQGANVEEDEVKKVVNFLISQGRINPELSNYNPDVIEPPSGSINVPGLKTKKGDIAHDDMILLYEEAKKLVIDLQMCSVSIVSGNLQINNKLAEKIIDELEKNGIVSNLVPGSTMQEVLIQK